MSDVSTVPLPIWSAATLLVVVAAIEAGYRLGSAAHARASGEKELPVSSIAATILALLAFLMAFTFGIVSNRYDARKALVREEANAIRTAWFRSDFLPPEDRGRTVGLLREYTAGRLTAVQSEDVAQVKLAAVQSLRIQRELWDVAVANARRDPNSHVAALYVESLNEVASLHASRVTLGLHARIPAGIWIAFYTLLVLSMLAVGYHAGLAGSRRSAMMLILALSFTLVITLIAALDRPGSGYFPVSQQPLEDVRDALGS